MKDSLLCLLDLQEIDKEIFTLERSKSEFPAEIDRLNSELAAGRGRIQETEERAAELERKRRAMEGDLVAIEHDLKKHQERLYEVKSNKEYDALQTEIETLTIRKEDHEAAILQSLGASEDLDKKLAEDRAAFKEREADILVRVEALTEKLNSVESDISGWDRKRGGLVSQIDRAPLSTYDRIRRQVKGGVAVVSVRKGSCGGCYRQLSPQVLVEARRTSKVVRCENCGRIIVWKDEEEIPV
jgi:predicted  nucleic acid-binding Zn-ribbon protein